MWQSSTMGVSRVAGPGDPLFSGMIIGPMDPCDHDMVKWQFIGEHAEPLGSLGLNGAGDDPVDEHIPTGEGNKPYLKYKLKQIRRELKKRAVAHKLRAKEAS
ncbi:mitochondrial substrate carrier family protein Y [Dorcoceras hygrometricum]|uniref:Mitochondrial substrate carrier family protein Y n=1 Tax=Dorcoceras hygrometricum TaxID=472368 RepID=A0A2Z7CSS7_9LAMI|nr:mitochondrial substrate carrier family protein Y [Dorcoceras hygrometricum]